MTGGERALIREAIDLLDQLPSGIDAHGVDEDDPSPEDATFHIGSLAARRLLQALGEYDPE